MRVMGKRHLHAVCLAAAVVSLIADHSLLASAFGVEPLSSLARRSTSNALGGRKASLAHAQVSRPHFSGGRTGLYVWKVSSFSGPETTGEKDFPKEGGDRGGRTRIVGGFPAGQSKLRRLKDRMWVREALEDLTSADFACSIEEATKNAEAFSGAGNGDGEEMSRLEKRKKRKRAVDFENIISKLDRKVEEMCVVSTYGEGDSLDALSCYPIDNMSWNSVLKTKDTCYSLVPDEGAGSVVYTNMQRDALLRRILKTRQRLLLVMGVGMEKSDTEPDDEDGLDEIRLQLNAEPLKDSETETKVPSDDKKSGSKGIDPLLYIRDDGTIDWDGALQEGEALKKFGVSVWARINGQDPESIDEETVQKAETGQATKVTAKIEDTEEIREKRDRLQELETELAEMTKSHDGLLNSAVSVSSPTASFNLGALDAGLRSEIRTSAEALEEKQDETSCQLMIYELERIYTYLDTELGNTMSKGYIPLQDRLNVAEFGLLESQIATFEMQLRAGEFVDTDVLAIVLDQVTDFKRRLGIDYYVTGLSFDKEAIQRYSSDLWVKTKKGFLFYVKGVALLWNDIIYSVRLIGTALRGITLKPREVRTLRRSVKDIITFIPFVIILLIPLSPVGHVIVFGAIQRVFPDFFPSCFTERRQNLLELYESTEYTEVVIEENWNEKVKRAIQASAFNVGYLTKQILNLKNDSTQEGVEDANENDEKKS